MPQIYTLGSAKRRKLFCYEGNVRTGTILNFSDKSRISAELYRNILHEFNGRTVIGGFSMTDPIPGGLGDWILSNSGKYGRILTPRHGSFISAILVNEGYAKSILKGNLILLKFEAFTSVSKTSTTSTIQNKSLNYAHIFELIKKSLFNVSTLPHLELENKLERFRNINYKELSDKEIFWRLVQVIFYSGMRATTVEDHLPILKEYFDDYLNVKNSTLESYLNNYKLIRNRSKISAIIYNANKFDSLIKKYGSFNKYLDSYGSLNDIDNLNKLSNDLRRDFKYLGPRTVYHFLTDLGFNVLKPDRVICRIFYRLNFISNEADIIDTVNVGRLISNAANEPIRFIDIIFVLYGQVGNKKEFGLENGICLSNPRCHLCRVTDFCSYYRSKSDI